MFEKSKKNKNKYVKKIATQKTVACFLLFSLFLVSAYFYSRHARAAITKEISYQGKLTDTSGVAVADGNYGMVINLYTDLTGGTPIWTARGTVGSPTARSVAVANGIFSIMLGDTAAGDNAIALDFNSTYYLGIRVGSDSEMAPRKKVGASGYAFNSDLLDGLDSATSGANAHIVATDASGNLFVSGNVGVGTTSPAEILDVNGRMRLAQTTAPGTTTDKLYNVSGNIFWNGINLSGGGALPSGTSGQTLRHNGTNWIANSLLYNDGTNIGIGTTSPLVKFDIMGTGNGLPATSGITQPNASARFGNSMTNGVLDIGINGGSGAWLQYANRTDLSQNYPLLLNPNGGNVGIGTTTPAEILDVNGRMRLAQTTAPGTTTDKLYNVSGNIFWNGINLSGGGALPSGTSGQTLRHNGTNWIANSLLYNDGTNIGIGTTSPDKLFQLQGGHTTSQEHLYAYVNGGNQDANLFLWASEPGLTYTGVGISNNWRYTGSWGRQYTGTGGSSMRLLDDSINFSTVTNAGVQSTGIVLTSSSLTISPTSWTATPTISGLITATNGMTSNGTFTLNGQAILGDGGDDIAINSNDWDISSAGAISGITTIGMSGQLTSTLATGTSPFAVTSTTVNTNLNADYLDGIDSSAIIYGSNGSGSRTASTVQNLNELAMYKSGFWDVSGASWTPNTGWWWGNTLAHISNSSSYLYGAQTIFSNSLTPQMYIRGMSGGATPTAGNWQKVWTDFSDGAGSGLDADLWDGYQFASYLDQAVLSTSSPTFAGLTVNGNIEYTGALNVNKDNVKYYRNVAHFSDNNPTITGTMKITMPKTWSNTMMQMRIQGYDYNSTHGAWEVIISGYNYSTTPAWSNYTAEIKGRAPFSQVRLAHDGTNNVLLLGTTTTIWAYPKITISEFIAGHSNIIGWESGWTIAPITDETGIAYSVSPTPNTYFAGNSSYYVNPSGQLTLNTDETINGIDIGAGVISDATWNGAAITDGYVADAITISGGTIGSNNISGTLTTTGTLTVGDNGDNIILSGANVDIYSNGSATFGTTSSAADIVVSALSADGYNVGFEAYGASQGTGYLFVGQSATYGGGIFYNGDLNPAFATGESGDAISFYRRAAGVSEVVFSYPYNSNSITFRGNVFSDLGISTYDTTVSDNTIETGQLCLGNGTNCITSWTNAGGGVDVSGTPTANYLAKWTDSNTITSSIIYDNGTNIGIGTTSPATDLDVMGGSDGSNTGIFRIGNKAGTSSNTGSSVQFYSGENTPAFVEMGRIGTLLISGSAGSASSDLAFSVRTAGTLGEVMRIENGGNVGIGTTNPSYRLHVNGGDIYASGDIRIAGDDLFMATNTSGYLLIADGTNFNPVAMSGDVTITSAGVTSIAADALALGTNTTGNYVAGLTAGTGITIGGTAGEGWSPTVGVTADSLDFTEFQDTLDLDANLITNQSTYTSTHNFTGTTTTGFTYNASALTSGTGMLLSSNSITSGNLLKVDYTTTADTAAFTGNLGLFSLASTWTGASSPTNSGNMLEAARSITMNSATYTNTISGAVFRISDAATLTAGAITHTANALEVVQSYTSNTGAAANITTAGTGLALRVNDDGTLTDTTPFIIDASGNVGIGTTSTTSKLYVNGTTTLIGDFNVTESSANTVNFTGTKPASVATTPATSAAEIFDVAAPAGGDTTIATTGVGGVGSGMSWVMGAGGVAASAATQSTGGAGGAISFTAGAGGAAAAAGIDIGGTGGNATLTGGNGGAATVGTSLTGGAGGYAGIFGGAAGAGGNANGGSVYVRPGARTGTGTSSVYIGDANATGISFGNATTNPTFTFNGSGLVTVTGGLTSTGTLTANGAFDANGAVTLGDNGDNVTIDSSVWDVTAAGAISGITGYAQSSGNFAISGTGTFGTGTGAISLNGATTLAANQSFTMTSGTGAFTQTYTGTATAATMTANSLTSGNILSLVSSSTAAAAGNTGLKIAISGANATAAITRYGIYSTVTATNATSGTNTAAYFSASGATTANYGLYVNAGTIHTPLGAGTVTTDASGNLTVSSDERLKNINGSFNRGIEAILSIEPVSYHWKKDTGLDTQSQYTGFSAQNIQSTIPEAVGIDKNGYLTLSDRPILATTVNAIKQQQKLISEISDSQTLISDQLPTIEDKLLKLTDENITYQEKITLIGTTLAQLSEKQNEQTIEISDISNSTSDIQAALQTLQQQMDLIKQQNQTILDFAVALDVKKLIYKDEAGDLDLQDNKVIAAEMVAGVFTVKITDPEAKTIGEAVIKKITKDDDGNGIDDETGGDGKSVKIETTAVTEKSKIYVTPVGSTNNQVLFVDEIRVGESFMIRADNAVESDVTFNWWTIEVK